METFFNFSEASISKSVPACSGIVDVLVRTSFLNSCTLSKYPHSYFANCEDKFEDFTNLSSCGLKEIKKDCEDNFNCKNENSRFVNIIKRLQIMVDNKEISDNEAMFRYLNIIDSEELRHNATKKMYFSHYQHYSNDFYMRGIPSCYFSRSGFCY